MTEQGPVLVLWSDHALVKAQMLGFARADVEETVLADHARRSRNTGAADWILRSGPLAIAYDYPTADELTALIVTLWRQR